MLDRDRMLAAIDDAYARRAAGDKAGLASSWAPGATFQLVGDAALLAAVPIGPAGAAEAVEQLIDMIRFHAFERLNAVVEGNQAAVRWRITASVLGGEPVESELFDLWTFDDQYRA
ncbi:MAG: nuclear transport factor 2 family protein, partial [Sphingomonadales bacterium]